MLEWISHSRWQIKNVEISSRNDDFGIVETDRNRYEFWTRQVEQNNGNTAKSLAKIADLWTPEADQENAHDSEDRLNKLKGSSAISGKMYIRLWGAKAKNSNFCIFAKL